MSLHKWIIFASASCALVFTALGDVPDLEPPADSDLALMQAAKDPQQDFFEAYETAKEAGASEATLLQARVIHNLVTGNLQGLLSMIDELEAHQSEFETGYDPVSAGSGLAFTSPLEIEGLIAALKAVKAYRDDDMAAFEKHAKAAYWKWPSWPQMFQIQNLIQEKRSAEVIDRYMADLSLPLDTPLRQLDGEPVTLGALVEGHKAALLDFWASWCGPCIRLMPELQARANALPAQGVFVAGVNTDQESPLEKAAEVKETHSMDMPWIVESEEQTLSRLLVIDSIPRVALVAPDGKLLFTGHPNDPELEVALAKLGVELPAAGEE